MTKMVYKKYVDVIVRDYADGTIIPLAIWWNDEKLYNIDSALDIRLAASLKAGGTYVIASFFIW